MAVTEDGGHVGIKLAFPLIKATGVAIKKLPCRPVSVTENIIIEDEVDSLGVVCNRCIHSAVKLLGQKHSFTGMWTFLLLLLCLYV